MASGTSCSPWLWWARVSFVPSLGCSTEPETARGARRRAGTPASPGHGPVAVVPRRRHVAGAEDRIVDAGLHSARLHREVPGSGLWVVLGEGHMVHHGAAGVVADALEAVSMAVR